jgi:hypothetical protein
MIAVTIAFERKSGKGASLYVGHDGGEAIEALEKADPAIYSEVQVIRNAAPFKRVWLEAPKPTANTAK